MAELGPSFGLSPGQWVGNKRFELKRLVGRGGFGEVWLAQDHELEEEVALKFVPRILTADSEALDDLRIETRRSRSLTHPNIIRIHDFCRFEGEPPFISMEYVEGVTLSALKTDQPQRAFTWEYLQPLVKQLCQALSYAHSEKVIHRDLKPGNMMLDTKGRLKLADFGISATTSDSVSRLSRELGSSGTPAYMSPQQMTSQPPKVTDDIYALGATLYELLTGKPPFYTGDIFRQVQEIPAMPLEQRLEELGKSNPIPADVSAMIMACLSKQPDQRPQSAAAVAEWIGLSPDSVPRASAITEHVYRAGAEPEYDDTYEEEKLATTTSGARSHFGLWVMIGLLVLAISGFAIWKTQSKDGDSITPPPSGDAVAEVSSSIEKPVSPMAVAKPATPAISLPRWTNTLGMVFVQLPDTEVFVSIWETRVRDFETFVASSSYDATKGMRFSLESGAVDMKMGNGRHWKNPGFVQTSDHPVVCTSWDDAMAFCRWLTALERGRGKIAKDKVYRLPKREEWRKAMGIDENKTPAELQNTFPWGDQWPPLKGAGNYAGSETSAGMPPAWKFLTEYTDAFPRTAPVGSFAPNAFGIFDLGGNVKEWSADAPPNTKDVRLMYGASWLESRRDQMRSITSWGYSPWVADTSEGFRVVLVRDDGPSSKMAGQ